MPSAARVAHSGMITGLVRRFMMHWVLCDLHAGLPLGLVAMLASQYHHVMTTTSTAQCTGLHWCARCATQCPERCAGLQCNSHHTLPTDRSHTVIATHIHTLG
eukprot:scpid91103/ scgid13226/ 